MTDKTYVSSFELKPMGMRTLKTGLAVILTLFLGQTFLITNPLYAVIGTILGVQNTVKESFQKGATRVYGTILGGIIGYLFIVNFTPHPLLIGFVVILTIYLCHCLNLNSAISIAVTVCVSILLGSGDQNPLIYSFFRTTDTAIGVLIGVGINYLVAQPKPSQTLIQHIETFHSTGDALFHSFIQGSTLELTSLKEQLGAIDHSLEDTIDDKRLERIQSQLPFLKEAVEDCHDYYFHLKCLKRLSEEPITLPVEDLMVLYESNVHSDVLHLSSSIEILFDYHFKKIIQLQEKSAKSFALF